MSTYSNYIKTSKDKDLAFFFGDIHRTSNKYFTFNRIVDNDTIIVLTSNIETIKGSPVLVVADNKGVYLKDWQVRKVHNYYEDVETYAVKLNRKFFKPYTFRFSFEDVYLPKELNFDDFIRIAREQTADNMAIAEGWMN